MKGDIMLIANAATSSPIVCALIKTSKCFTVVFIPCINFITFCVELETKNGISIKNANAATPRIAVPNAILLYITATETYARILNKI